MNIRQIAAFAALFVLGLTADPSTACTGIQLTAKDGSVVHARTLEFGEVLPPVIVAIPKGIDQVGMAPSGAPGLKWKTSYAAVGMGMQGNSFLADGVNEQGLASGLFYHPGYAKYAEPQPGEENRVIAPFQLISYLLTTCATVEDARLALESVIVAPTVLKEMGFAPPIHAIVRDATGASIVIEFLNGQTVIYDNPVGVITNDPTFDWHLTNLGNYINLSPTNVPSVMEGDLELSQLGQGSGLLGLPGDYTPPSRFIRAVAFTQSADKPESATDAINTAFHILDSFDIVKGVVRSAHGSSDPADFTQWTSAADMKSGRYYFRTYANPQIRVVDLHRLDLSSGQVLYFPVDDKEPTFEDVTSKLVQ
ncbi:MAG: choloylglycine hydrolase family protein [Pirellulales bacterium]